jgi:molybdopterin synthase catalytic subunit
MKTHIQFTTAPIVPPPSGLPSREIGACVEFSGIVRELENGVKIPGLFYEAYETMARKELEKIFQELSGQHSCAEAWLVHRLGFVPTGEASLFIRILAQHRQPALDLMAELINRLKQDVPIWKRS